LNSFDVTGAKSLRDVRRAGSGAASRVPSTPARTRRRKRTITPERIA
jgi:hypothetical protein